MDKIWVIEKKAKPSFGDVVGHSWEFYVAYPTKQAADIHLESIYSHLHDFRITEFVRKESNVSR